MNKLNVFVRGNSVGMFENGDDYYISLTDIARYKNPDEPKDIVKNWMRSKNTIEFLGLWEKLHNPDFKGVEFDSFVNQAGSNAFVLSPTKWITSTGAIGIIAKAGNNGGTYAHNDIAFEFSSWISAEFKLYLLLEFQAKLDGKKQRVDYRTAGAKEAMARYGELIGKILAYPIAGHHAGLADYIGADDDACLEASVNGGN